MSRNKKHKIETKAVSPHVPSVDPSFTAQPRVSAMLRDQSQISAGVVWRAIDILAGYCRTVRSQFVQAKDHTSIVTLSDVDPLKQLMDRPNSMMSWGDFRYAAEVYRLMYGGWIGILIGADGKPTDDFPISILLFPIKGFIRTCNGGDLRDARDYYRSNGWANRTYNIQVTDTQCVCYTNFDPNLRGRPINQLGFAALPSEVQQSVLRYQQALLNNDNRPGVIVTTEKVIKEGTRETMQSKMMDSYGGVQNAGRMALLSSDGKYTVTVIDPLKITEVSNKDYNRELTRDVGVAFGIPEFILSANADNANKATAQQLVSRFMSDTVEPIFELHEQTWNTQFFDRFGKGVHIDYDQWSLSAFRDVAADRMDLVKARLETGDTPEAAYRFAGIPFEANKQSNKPVLGTSLTQIQDYVPPVAVVPTKEPTVPSKEPVPEPVKLKEPQPEPELQPEPKKNAQLDSIRGTMLKMKAARNTVLRKQGEEIWNTCVAAHEQKMVTSTEKCIKRQKAIVMKKLNTYFNTGRILKDDDRIITDTSFFVDLDVKGTPKIPGVGDIDAFLPDEDYSNSELQLGWRASFEDVRLSTEAQMEKELGDISNWYGTAPEQHRDIALDRLGDAVKVNKTTRDQIKQSMTRALGDMPNAQPLQIAQTLRSEVNHVFNSAITRANTIARTELGSVMSDYRAKIMESEGVEKVRWVSAHDPHVRPSHAKAEADGPLPIGTKFSNGLTQPHQANAPAGEVINCRCVLVSAK